MRLNVEDPRIEVQVRILPDGRGRLQITYPARDGYPARVFAALADLVRPIPAGKEKPLRELLLLGER